MKYILEIREWKIFYFDQITCQTISHSLNIYRGMGRGPQISNTKQTVGGSECSESSGYHGKV